MINSFRGQYYFLSNYFTAPIEYKGITYQNNEAAFQAQKVFDQKLQQKFATLPPNEAKRLGRKVTLRKDWDDVRIQVMTEIVRAKFAQHPNLCEKLIATGDTELIEGNTWNDTFWGVCNGIGENHLGQILMKVRDEIIATSKP